jgi:hypothetical protein
MAAGLQCRYSLLLRRTVGCSWVAVQSSDLLLFYAEPYDLCLCVSV